MTDKPLLISVKTAAKKLDCSKSRIYGMIECGKFEVVQEKCGIKGMWIVYASLERYIDGNKTTKGGDAMDR